VRKVERAYFELEFGAVRIEGKGLHDGVDVLRSESGLTAEHKHKERERERDIR
jgi:hypothetical protein